METPARVIEYMLKLVKREQRQLKIALYGMTGVYSGAFLVIWFLWPGDVSTQMFTTVMLIIGFNIQLDIWRMRFEMQKDRLMHLTAMHAEARAEQRKNQT